MAFSVKATLVAFQGDPDRYPCHAMLEIGSEVIFDGAELKGKMCADVMPLIANACLTLQVAGPRYVPPGYYNIFWYAANSSFDPAKAVYDGNGFTPVNREYDEPPHHLRDLQPPGSFRWPPTKGRTVAKDFCVQCPDNRTAAVFKMEAFDLATAGYQLPYTRRQITIMDRVNKAGGTWPVDKILELYDDFEINDIYPTLHSEVINPMLEELELLGFAVICDGKVTVTKKGADRVARYKTEIPAEHAKALKL
jgi:hypothetical protein